MQSEFQVNDRVRLKSNNTPLEGVITRVTPNNVRVELDDGRAAITISPDEAATRLELLPKE
jgi:hypothetical protein